MYKKLKDLEVGVTFRLKTKQFYLRLHVYKIVEKSADYIVYKLVGEDQYNQATTTKGNELVKLINL